MSSTQSRPESGQTNVFIVGSCVTRDAFDRPGHGFRIADYVARSSFACSMRAAPFAVPFAEVDPDGMVQSNWQRRMVEIDLGRGLRRRLAAVPAPETTVVVVDFIDERFHLLALNGELATQSVELQRTRCAARPGAATVLSGSGEHFWFWQQGFRAFVAEAAGLGMETVVNRVHWTERTAYGEPLRDVADQIAAANSYLDRLYREADRLGLRAIDYGATEFVASAAHRWGPAPFHYVDAVYDRFLSELGRLGTGSAKVAAAAAT